MGQKRQYFVCKCGAWTWASKVQQGQTHCQQCGKKWPAPAPAKQQPRNPQKPPKASSPAPQRSTEQRDKREEERRLKRAVTTIWDQIPEEARKDELPEDVRAAVVEATSTPEPTAGEKALQSNKDLSKASSRLRVLAQVVGPARPLVLAVANITHWRPEILHWYQHTGADCLLAQETHLSQAARPLVLAVANITHWRPEILHWYQHTGADCLLAQETHLSQAQEAKAKATLVEVGLHSFWAGATATNSTKGGLVVATPWQAHPRLIQSFTVDGCGFIAVELPRVQWRLALVTVYLQTATGLQAEPNATIMAALLALLQRLPNWVAAGDWNVDAG
eukprot:s8494_g1.t1